MPEQIPIFRFHRIYTQKEPPFQVALFVYFTHFFQLHSRYPGTSRDRKINLSVTSGVGLFGGFCAEVHVEDLLSESDALGCYFQKLIVIDKFQRLLKRKDFRWSEAK